ncbi:potassium transporter TrkG [Paenibacillus cremeus]|uniref:Uncharacterized protein n=1 Tax=Paenibacillus cremeus TaxID=2163881 RepID=A0A559KE27_9BACL|nr:hypothetical protein FPZ49_08275 [Paenibacillus cremeus]
MKILFETVSAFGTVGYILGLTTDLSVPCTVLLIFLMFAGRLSPLTIAYAIHPEGIL